MQTTLYCNPSSPLLHGGKRRLPCHARSVPPNHTAETAYFEIPPGAEHGMRLTCSHPACAGKGAKRVRHFQYCAVCCRAVSSQNFHLRHSHSDSIQTIAVFDSQEMLSTVELTQRDCEWLQLRHSRPALSADNSREDLQQWTESVLVTMPLDMQKWMMAVLNLSEMTRMSVPAAATFPTPVVGSPNLNKGNFSASPCDSVGSSTFSSGQNEDVACSDEETLVFESLSLTSCTSMSDMSNRFNLMEQTKQAPCDSVGAFRLSSGQNDDVGCPDEETLVFECLTSSSSMSDLSNLFNLTEETKLTPCDSVGVSTLSPGKNNDVGCPGEDTLPFESLMSMSSTSISDLLNLFNMMEEIKQTPCDSVEHLYGRLGRTMMSVVQMKRPCCSEASRAVKRPAVRELHEQF